MLSNKDLSDKEDLSKISPQNNKEKQSEQIEIKKKEEDDFDKCWDEYDDGDEEEISL